MEAKDGDAETVVSSLNGHSQEPNINGDEVSAEDLAWVDSCLVSDSDTVDRNWESLKDALLDISNSQPLPHYDADRSDHSLEETRIENVNISGVANADQVYGKITIRDDNFMEVETSQYEQSNEGLTFSASTIQPNQGYDAQEDAAISGHDLKLLSHGIESPIQVLSRILNEQPVTSVTEAVDGAGDEVYPPSKRTEAKKNKGKIMVDDGNSSESNSQKGIDDQRVNDINFLGNPFRADYSDDIQGSVFVDTVLNAEFSPFEFESITDDIFREWELNIPEEEDELIKQLNKSLDGNISQTIPSSFDDLSASTEESVDSLIAALNGLVV